MGREPTWLAAPDVDDPEIGATPVFCQIELAHDERHLPAISFSAFQALLFFARRQAARSKTRLDEESPPKTRLDVWTRRPASAIRRIFEKMRKKP